jgi:hypothetical protein
MMVKGALPFIASVIAVSCASATAFGLWHETASAGNEPVVAGTSARAPDLLEAHECAIARSVPVAEPTASTTGDEGASVSAQQLVVVVPPTVIVRVDGDGQLVSVSTNTGCAPRPLDVWWVMQPDGTATRASAAAFARQRWMGDFTQTGVAQAQP